MKNIFTLFLLSFVTILGAQSNKDIEVPLSNPGKIGFLKTHLHHGSIIVIGEDRDNVVVNYDLDEDDNHEEEDSRRGGLKRVGRAKSGIKITEDNNIIEIDSDSKNKDIEITIIVPLNFNIEISNHNGDDLTVENITGEINIESHNSDISALNISGFVNANTYNGDVEISFDKIPSSKDMAFSSYNGDIDISLPSSYRADFKLKTVNGEILSDLDIEEVGKTPEFKSSKKGSFKLYTDTWTYAKLNGGGNEIKINTHSGDIMLRAK